MRYFSRIMLPAVLAVMFFHASARADGGCGAYYGYGYPWFGYGNNGPAAYALGNIPAPPYFALHPPVYYSHPVARPYGHSPFACPNGCPNHALRRAPRILVNPFVEQKPVNESDNQPAPAKVNVAAVPTRFSNPYYDAEIQPESSLAKQ